MDAASAVAWEPDSVISEAVTELYRAKLHNISFDADEGS